MTSLTKTQTKTLHRAAKSGFTFMGDSHFRSFASAKRAINGLVARGYLIPVTDKDGRTEYKLSAQGVEFVEVTSYLA